MTINENLRKVKLGGTNDQRDHGFFASPCSLYACGKSHLRTHHISQGFVPSGCPSHPKDGYPFRGLRGIYFGRGTLARVLLREGCSFLRPKLVLFDQDGWLRPHRPALHLPDHSVRFLEEILR